MNVFLLILIVMDPLLKMSTTYMKCIKYFRNTQERGQIQRNPNYWLPTLGALTKALKCHEINFLKYFACVKVTNTKEILISIA